MPDDCHSVIVSSVPEAFIAGRRHLHKCSGISPSVVDRTDADSGESGTRVTYDLFVRHFEMELGWKDSLESKAVAFLGFVGIFLAVLVSLAALRQTEPGLDLSLLALPMFLQVSSAILVFSIVSGYTIVAGPALTDVFEARRQSADLMKTGALVSYGTSILANRVLFTRMVLLFRLAVMLVAISLLQLGISVAAASWDPSHAGWIWVDQWILWVPGGTVALVGGILLLKDYSRLSRTLTQELRRWAAISREIEAGTETLP